MKRPQPPRRPGLADAGSGGPDKVISDAQSDLVAADAEVARVSKDRLAQLLAQGVRQRLRHFDDPDLIPADRIRLRASVLETSRQRRQPWAAVLDTALDTASVMVRYPRSIMVIAALTIGLPAALHAVTVHDGDLAVVTRVTRVTMHNPDGTSAHGAFGPGVALVVSGYGPMVQAREWIAGVGYRTYDVDARDVEVNRRSPWHALMAFAAAIHAGWSPPASRS